MSRCPGGVLPTRGYPLNLDLWFGPTMGDYPPRSLTDASGRELTRKIIEDTILGGDGDAWHTLIRALKKDDRGLLAFRIREAVGVLDRSDPKVAAFTALLPGIMQRAIARAAGRR